MQRRSFLSALFFLTASAATGLQAKQQPINFHFDSLPQGAYPRTPKEKEHIKDLILEAASEFKTQKYAPQPIDLAAYPYRTDIYFSEKQRSGSFYPYSDYCIIDLDHGILPFDGHLLSVAFHEFSHEYDALCGGFRNQIQENEMRKMKSIQDQNDEDRLQKLMHRSLLIRSEILRSEVSAYTRNISYLPELKKRKWSRQHTFEHHQEELHKDLEIYKRKLSSLEWIVHSGFFSNEN